MVDEHSWYVSGRHHGNSVLVPPHGKAYVPVRVILNALISYDFQKLGGAMLFSQFCHNFFQEI